MVKPAPWYGAVESSKLSAGSNELRNTMFKAIDAWLVKLMEKALNFARTDTSVSYEEYKQIKQNYDHAVEARKKWLKSQH